MFNLYSILFERKVRRLAHEFGQASTVLADMDDDTNTEAMVALGCAFLTVTKLHGDIFKTLPKSKLLSISQTFRDRGREIFEAEAGKSYGVYLMSVYLEVLTMKGNLARDMETHLLRLIAMAVLMTKSGKRE